jgi:cellulose synthase/poly-beta-1,6-N-acetylglucosamine synthase-like glycosyltransferase
MPMLDAAVWLAALVLAPPLALVGVESLASLGRRARGAPRQAPRTAVLIPAHDEEAEIARTLIEVRRELREGDRLVVVADNSTDATAEIAASHGAEVVERVDALRAGKGFALEAGIRHLASDPPEVVVVVDADCRPEPGALRRIAARAGSEERAVQGASLVAPSDAGFISKVSALAFHARNEIRPGGLEKLGLPVLLQGTGMAIPWTQIQGAPLGSDHLAEDRKLGIFLAIEGNSPRFEPEARFWSSLEPAASASGGQRSRWERGHFAVVAEEIPRLLGRAVRERRGDLGVLAAELSVPPLALLLKAWLASVLLALGLGASAPATAAVILPGAACFLLLGVASARSHSAPVSSGFLLAAPLYALAKAPLYVRALAGQKMGWVRARRGAADAEPAVVPSSSQPSASQCASAD